MAAAPTGVGQRTFTFVDRTRTLDDATRRGGPSGAPRTLVTQVYYPARTSGPDAAIAATGPFPIVLFSHGLRGAPADYRNLFARWAAAGYVVVAPTYPLTSTGADPVVPGDLLNQPADASFVLSSLLQQADQPGDPFHGALDGNRVVAAGHSEGALTTLGLFSGCCRDARLSGGIILAGDDVGFERDGYAGTPAPLLFFHGDADPLIRIGLARSTYARVPWPKGFVTLLGAAHIPPYLGDATPAAEVVNGVSVDFLRWVLRGDPAGLAALRQQATVSGVSSFEDGFH